MNEADTCRLYVVPRLQAAGWDTAPYSIAEQRIFSNPKGRIRVVGGAIVRGEAKRSDYLLRYRRDFPLAVVEAKAIYKKPGDGMGQAKIYAEMLGLKFAYSSNGTGIVEFDFITGLEKELSQFPTPAELWARLQPDIQLPPGTEEKALAPLYLNPERPSRYYQQVAVNRAINAILTGKKRLLITMATGTGKTEVAFQICYKLWNCRWTRNNDPVKKPKILFLADRNILVDDPKDKTFVPFGEARHKIENGEVVKSREMYFAIYQAIAEDERRPGLYKEYPPDFFDLIVVDECHRGSANESSTWRDILEHFSPAVQLGMTATPLRRDNKATYRYFGNPIYQYSLRQGLDDGFLAPYRVHRVVTSADATGWRPTRGELDKHGRLIPDEEYHTADFERRLSLRPRSEAIAKHLTAFLKKTGRFDKTIVFCVDQEHADEMRQLLNNLNADLVQQYPDYVCRVTSDEADTGKGHLGKFQELETVTPVILTTSQMLTTGVDAPMVKNVVLIRMIGAMTEFKQIIGRGTRLREDYGKFYFNILDYTGTATRHFADPEFDGDPEFVSEEEIDGDGNVVSVIVDPAPPTENGPEPEDTEPEDEDGTEDEPEAETDGTAVIIEPPLVPPPIKYYVEQGKIRIVTHITQDLDAEGRQLHVTEFKDFTAEVTRSLFTGVSDLRKGWSDPDLRPNIAAEFAGKGIDLAEALAALGKPEADPFDVLCHLAWNAPALTRKERAARVQSEQAAFFATFAQPARAILETLLTKYADHGPAEFSIPDSLKVPPLSGLGNAEELADRFGGPAALRDAVRQLQQHLYAA